VELRVLQVLQEHLDQVDHQEQVDLRQLTTIQILLLLQQQEQQEQFKVMLE
jgi:hypothetical protein